MMPDVFLWVVLLVLGSSRWSPSSPGRAQFAFVRRAGHVARPRVQERFGSCQTLCGAAEEL